MNVNIDTKFITLLGDPLRQSFAATMQHKGYEKNVVILTQPANYIKKGSRLNPLLMNSLKDYPAALKAMQKRPEAYNKSVRYVRECEMTGNAFVIAPSEKNNWSLFGL